MNIYPNITERDLINLRKLAEQQNNQRAEKIEKRILKQTHDVKLAESLSPITKNLVEVKEATEKLGDVVKESQPETPQLAIETIPKTHQPIEINEGNIYDVELEKTLRNMEKDNTGFFKTHHDSQRGWMLNNYPIRTPGGTQIEIDDNKYNITPGLQKVFTDTSYDVAKSLSDTEKVVFRDMLLKTGYYDRKPTKRRTSGHDRYFEKHLDNDAIRILGLDKKT